MATDPTPRSYQQILGDMLATFNSNYGLPQLKVGSPILRTFQAVAQSLFRSTNDIFAFLRSRDINQAKGQALINIAAEENLTPISETFATGTVTVTDTTFTKISTKLYPGSAAPIVGSTTIYVIDASSFTATGSLYIGRNTSNYEGPLTYTAKTNLGSFWSITLSSGTTNFHNVNESVILAQGGDRTIPSGSVVQTPQGNAQSASQFTVLYDAVIPDGETALTNVQVIAKIPGLAGNIPANTINAFVSAPFSGAVPTNPQPFTNAQAQETEDALRERIKNVRQSRSQGTPLAIQTNVLGIQAPDENKTITSASIYTAPGQPTTLYIDDGTGYEERDQGIAFETLVANATGSEQYFKVSGSPPVAKAFLTTSILSPFTLESGAQLAAIISGLTYIHTFDITDFQSISNATAYEVSASINSNSEIAFAARTYNNGTQVAIFAKQDTDESIQVTEPPTGIDANDFLGFSTTVANTLNLFKNDIFLNKDGRNAVLSSNLQSTWNSVSSPQTFIVAVNNTDPVTYTFTDQDFIDAGTGYITLNSANTLTAWAEVFNAKIPSLTASVSNGSLALMANIGASSRAAIEITGGTLISSGNFFEIDSSFGANSDYVFDRNRGEGYLAEPLASGDILTLGSVDNRAYIQSTSISTITLTSDAILWLFIDGAAQIIPTTINGSNSIALTTYTLTPPDATHVRVRATGDADTFADVEVGDWIIFADNTTISASNLGAWRVDYVDASTFAFVEFSRSALSTPETITTSSLGIVVVRSTAYPTKVTIPTATNYTATSLAESIGSQLNGGAAVVYRTNFLRLRTNTGGENGDIALVATNSFGQSIPISLGDATTNTSIKSASAENTSAEFGTPNFLGGTVLTAVSTTAFTVSSLATFGIKSNSQIVPVRDLPDDDTVSPGNLRSRFGSNVGYHSMVATTSGAQVNLRSSVLQEWLINNYFYVAAPLAIGPNDNFTALVDGDVESKRYTLNLYRNAQPTTSTYGLTNTYLDLDNSNLSFAYAFGFGSDSFDFSDFTVYMKARAKSHNEAGDTTKTVLWRWWNYGADGTNAKVSYVYPTSSDLDVSALTLPLNGTLTQVNVNLASDAARTGLTVRNTTKIGLIVTASGSLFQLTYILNLAIASATRDGANNTTLTLTLPGAGTDHGLQVNDVVYVKSTDVNFASGLYTITARAATTITYTEAGGAVGATPNIGTVSNDVNEATTTGSTAINGDIFSVASGSSLPSYAEVAVRTTTLAAGHWIGLVPSATTPFTVVIWSSLNDLDYLSAYPLKSSDNTAANIATAINAQAALPDSICPVTAVGVGVGGVATGVVTLASFEEFTNPTYGYQLLDGVNFVSTQTDPASLAQNYTFTFKDAIAASLATNSDWANETVRFAPTTAINLVNYFNAPGVSGLFNASEIINSTRGSYIQISSLTPGSTGSIQVQGGLGNSAGGSTLGNAQVASGAGLVLTFNTNDTLGLAGNMWVELRNSVLAAKPLFNATQEIASIAANGTFTFTNAVSTPMWSSPISPITGESWYFSREGQYFAIRYADDTSVTLTGVAEGDYLVISGAAAANNGTFRIIRVSNGLSTIWVDIPGGVEEVSSPILTFVDNGSLMPGDTFMLSSTSFGGTNNARQFQVLNTYDQANGWVFRVDNEGVPLTVFGTPTVLGTASAFFTAQEGVASTFIKQIVAMSPNPSTGALTDVRFDTSVGNDVTGAVYGTTLVVLNKLGFPTQLFQGLDAYNHAIGLIGQANRVAYGDLTQPTIYPGIIAAGANVNIAGPIVKRIQVSVAIRVQNGLSTTDVINRVQSAVATVINNTGVGQNIAISDIVDAANSIYGVTSVVISSPAYDINDDLISVANYEKPYVIDIMEDVLVTLIGT